MSRLLALLALAFLCSGPAWLSMAAEPSPEQQRQIRQLLVTVRGQRIDLDRRAKAAEDLAKLGPAGEAALKDFFAKEVRRLGATIKDPPGTSALDETIERLRKTLAELRKDRDLTKEKLQTVGLPAMEELMANYQQREAVLKDHYQRLSGTTGQLQQIVELLRRLQGQAGGGAPAPVGELLSQAEKLLTRASPGDDAEARKVLEESETVALKLNPQIAEGMRAVNRMRVACGLRPLLFDAKLCEAAHGHCADMQARNFFSHDSLVPGKATVADRAKLAGTTAAGENIYRGATSAAAAIKGWFLSPGHHKVMFFEPFRRQGLGRAGTYWTEVFGL